MNNNYWQNEIIRLRAVEPEDAEAFFGFNLDSEMARNLDFLWPPSSMANVREEVEKMARRKLENDAFFWVIENADGEAVGQISTHNCDQRNGTFQYGVSVSTDHQRRGYARSAIGMVLRYYFEELRYQKVTVAIHADNSRSIALHEALRFVKEGTLRRMFFTGGEYVDLFYFGMTREEWEA